MPKKPDIVAAGSGLVTIDDSNYRRFLDPQVVKGEKKARGLIPRLFSTHPVGCYAVAEPFALPLIPEGEWDDRIAQQEKDKSSLQHIRDQGAFGQSIPSRDQDGRGYCWAHSTVSAMLLSRALNNQPYADLSAYAIACIIKNYRDEGGWNGESLEFATKRGCPTSEFWPQRSVSRQNDRPETWENARLHTVQEWWDLSDRKSEAKQQLATCLLLNVPVMIDLNWWSHSVCACRLIKRDPFTVRIWNSWGDGWSDRGMGDLVGGKAIPDGAAAPRVLFAADK